MNMENILNNLTQGRTRGDHNSAQPSSPIESISSLLPGGLAGGAAAGGVMALLLGSKSTRKMAKKVVKFGGTAVLGGLAYKAYDNWQQNKALGQTKAINDNDIAMAAQHLPLTSEASQPNKQQTLTMTLIKTMIAASKADGNIDAEEHKRIFDMIEKVDLDTNDKALVFDLMAREITIQEIADSVSLDDHKAEVYLSAYLAIEVDNQHERTFLNNLAIALDLPRGFPAYLEQQADQGVQE